MSLVSLIGLPLSIVSKTDKNLEFFCIILAKAYKYFDRSNGANLDHFGNAFFAAFTARSTSFFDETDNLPIFFLLLGFIIFNFLLPDDLINLLFIKILFGLLKLFIQE